MSDDIVERLRNWAFTHNADGVPILIGAVDEIVRLRTRVAELEADKRAQAACMDANGAHYAQELSFWQDLANQLAEACLPGFPTGAYLRWREDGNTAAADELDEYDARRRTALAAYDRARTPATPTEDQ